MSLSGARRQVAQARIRLQLSQQISPHDRMGRFHGIPTTTTTTSARHSCRTMCHANLLEIHRVVRLDLSFEFVNVWILPADGTSGSESGAEWRGATTGQITLLHKLRTNEDEGRARRCYVIKFRSGGGGDLDPWWPTST